MALPSKKRPQPAPSALERPNIRRACVEDLPAIGAIYNSAILTSDATFDLKPQTLQEQQAWWKAHGAPYPVLVAERDGAVVGWAALSKFSDREAYAGTVENSIYIQEKFQGQGIGRLLLRELMEAGQEAGFHSVIAKITAGNQASLKLHYEEGFQNVGTLKEVGRKFDRLLDVQILQKIYARPAF